MLSSRPLLILSASLALYGCGTEATRAAGEPEAPVVARVHGQEIGLDTLDEAIAPTLSDLRQQEYDARREALEVMIAERLVEAEARKRGIEKDELLRQEVDARLGAPDPAQLEAVYAANQARFQGQSREQALARIGQALVQRARLERYTVFVAGLRTGAVVEIHLDVPRSEVPFPTSAPVLGPADAPVTIVEYTDYQCPYCARAQTTVDELLARYAGKIRLVYRDLPLDFHSRAFPASRAARCAGEQQRFWEYHRGLLVSPGDFSDADLDRRAVDLGIDRAAFGECLASDRHSAEIRASLDEATRLGVQSTPTFFINGRRLSGAQPIEKFVAIIEEELGGRSS